MTIRLETISSTIRCATEMSLDASDEKGKTRLPPVIQQQDHGFRPASKATKGTLGCLILLILLVVGGLWLYLAHKRSEEAKVARQAAEMQAKRQALQDRITDSAKRYNAITGWRQKFGSREIEEAIYSAELSAVLVNADPRPVLFIVGVRDVTQIDGKWKVSLRGTINPWHDIVLHLSCSEVQANVIMSSPKGEDNRFSVIAVISSVDSTEEETKREVDGSWETQTVSTATGQLVDVQFLGSDYDPVMEDLSAPLG